MTRGTSGNGWKLFLIIVAVLVGGYVALGLLKSLVAFLIGSAVTIAVIGGVGYLVLGPVGRKLLSGRRNLLP